MYRVDADPFGNIMVVQCMSVFEIEWGSFAFVLSASDESFSIEINSKQELWENGRFSDGKKSLKKYYKIIVNNYQLWQNQWRKYIIYLKNKTLQNNLNTKEMRLN